jgi:2-oxoglutarate dehydrogenase E2 component (dihydrolipoamide succinyltransferase)
MLKGLLRALRALVVDFFHSDRKAGRNNRSSSMDIVVPEVGESIFEATVSKWHVADGDSVKKDDLLCELETDKISLELNAESSGTIRLQVKEGETVKVGATIATLGENGKTEAGSSGGKEAAEQDTTQGAPAQESGRKSADQEKTAEKDEQKPADKSSDEEKESKIEQPERETPKQPAAPAQGVTTAPAPKPLAPVIPIRDDQRTRRVAMTPIRKKIAAHLLYARQQTAMLTTFNEADLSIVQKLRSEHKEAFQQKHDVKLGLMSFFIRGCILALKEFPEVNARIDGSDIVYQEFYDIGVAIGGEKGLVVPVIRDVEQLDYADIEKAIQGYGEKVKNNKIELADLEGGTFTVSNGGVYGSMLSTPIINPPQCAVLGMHAIKERVVVVDGEIVVRPMMYLALSYDHRLIDGKQAVGFLRKVKEFVENPDPKLLKL